MDSLISEALVNLDPISLSEMDRVKLMNRVDTKFAFSKDKLVTILPQLASFYRILEIENTRAPIYESLYLDDNAFNFFRDHHNGRTNRFKIRFRKYVESNLTFLEIKHKRKGRTDKKRIKVDQITENLLDKHLLFIRDILNDDRALKAVLWNSFHRLTLVNKVSNERLTLDFDLNFKWKDQSTHFSNLIIAELKQENLDRSSPFFSIMKAQTIRPYRLSKYCLGSIELYGNLLKFNRFKRKLLKLKKIDSHAA
jgi:hypothetical protein